MTSWVRSCLNLLISLTSLDAIALSDLLEDVHLTLRGVESSNQPEADELECEAVEGSQNVMKVCFDFTHTIESLVDA